MNLTLLLIVIYSVMMFFTRLLFSIDRWPISRCHPSLCLSYFRHEVGFHENTVKIDLSDGSKYYGLCVNAVTYFDLKRFFYFSCLPFPSVCNKGHRALILNLLDPSYSWVLLLNEPFIRNSRELRWRHVFISNKDIYAPYFYFYWADVEFKIVVL